MDNDEVAKFWADYLKHLTTLSTGAILIMVIIYLTYLSLVIQNMECQSSGIIGRLLEILLPQNGYVMQLAEAYFDESGSHDGSPVLCVAGYIFEKNACM